MREHRESPKQTPPLVALGARQNSTVPSGCRVCSVLRASITTASPRCAGKGGPVQGLWRKRRPTRATPLARKRSSEPKPGVAGGRERAAAAAFELHSGSGASFRRGKPIPECNAGSLPKAFQCARLLSPRKKDPPPGSPKTRAGGFERKGTATRKTNKPPPRSPYLAGCRGSSPQPSPSASRGLFLPRWRPERRAATSRHQLQPPSLGAARQHAPQRRAALAFRFAARKTPAPVIGRVPVGVHVSRGGGKATRPSTSPPPRPHGGKVRSRCGSGSPG